MRALFPCGSLLLLQLLGCQGFFSLSKAVDYFLRTFQLHQHPKAVMREVIGLELERKKMPFRQFICLWNTLTF